MQWHWGRKHTFQLSEKDFPLIQQEFVFPAAATLMEFQHSGLCLQAAMQKHVAVLQTHLSRPAMRSLAAALS